MKKTQIQTNQEIDIQECALNELWKQMREDPEYWAYEVLQQLSHQQIQKLAQLHFESERDYHHEIIPKAKKPEKPKMEILDF